MNILVLCWDRKEVEYNKGNIYFMVIFYFLKFLMIMNDAATNFWVLVFMWTEMFISLDRTWVYCIAGRFFTIYATREAHNKCLDIGLLDHMVIVCVEKVWLWKIPMTYVCLWRWLYLLCVLIFIALCVHLESTIFNGELLKGLIIKVCRKKKVCRTSEAIMYWKFYTKQNFCHQRSWSWEEGVE